MLGFMHKVHVVALDIMSCFAIGLGLPEDFYVQVHTLCLAVMLLVMLMREKKSPYSRWRL